jgi:hypothetical protein
MALPGGILPTSIPASAVVSGLSGMGLYAPSTQMLPANPVRRSGMGCLGCAGLGQTSSSFDLSSIGTSISNAWTQLNSQTVAGMPMGYVLIGGAAVLIVVMGMSGGKASTLRKAAQYKAKDAYQAQLARIKDQYPGLTARARKALARAS